MILSVTGHRPNKLGGYDQKIYNRLCNFAVLQLRKLVPTKVITGMALGWDTAIADSCVKLDIPFIAAIPFANQERMWPLHSQIIYTNLLQKSEKVEIIDKNPYFSLEKMHQRNEWMVNQSDMLLALWNGTKGGTDHCIKFARKNNKPIINVWDEWCQYCMI